METLTQEREALQQQVGELNTQVTTLGVEREELQSRAETVEVERDELLGRVEMIEAERDELQSQVRALTDELAQARQEIVNLSVERDEILAELQIGFEEQLSALRRELRETEGLVEVIEEQRIEIRERVDEGVLPPLHPQGDEAGTPTPTAEISPGEQINQLKERIEQLENQATDR